MTLVMAAKVKKQAEFEANIRLNLEVGVTIQADSLEEATQKAKELDVTDVVTIHGGHNDSKLWVNGVFRVGNYVDEGVPA